MIQVHPTSRGVGIWGRTSLVGWCSEKIAGWSGFLSVRSNWFNFLCSGNAVATHRKTLIIVKILHWKSTFTFLFSHASYKTMWAYSSSWDSIFQFIYGFCLFLAHKLVSDRTHASDSIMSYEVYSEETGQPSSTENISMDAGFLPKHLSARMEVALLVTCLHKQSELWRSWLQQCSVLCIAAALI